MYAAGNVNYGHGIQPFLWKLDRVPLSVGSRTEQFERSNL